MVSVPNLLVAKSLLTCLMLQKSSPDMTRGPCPCNENLPTEDGEDDERRRGVSGVVWFGVYKTPYIPI